VLAGIDLVRTYTQGRGIWAVDRGGDRKKLLEPLLDRHERFVIRSTGKRFVIDRKNVRRSVAELGAQCRLRHSARIIKIQDGQEKTYDLRYGVEPIRLAGRDEQLYLVVVAGFGEEPMLLLTNALEGARDSQSLWWIVQIYLTRWKIEETFRFIKQSYGRIGSQSLQTLTDVPPNFTAALPGTPSFRRIWIWEEVCVHS
jgi:hypothetical protein